ncbi:S8 family serine peptidase [Dinghuibacter silviterrae]|uniref:Subtilase family protein n=1 Tax=Dinghuibacter silviterrae TaxID=1539049 RepID=A0A4R8DV82_9BACT|nr:S8 family serine peptidase [Dinghuibacter silviterrae]TDX01828.1 subtilase family protein [Dinghuibacter silviterrae]
MIELRRLIKNIIFITALFCLFYVDGTAQKVNWQNLDMRTDSVLGVSTEKAYATLLKGRKSSSTIVAIIDSGIDTLHEDLKSVLWINSRNGSHGWNFIGQEMGQEDIVHIASDKKEFYDSLSYAVVPVSFRKEYSVHCKDIAIVNQKIDADNNFIERLKQSKAIIERIVQKMGRDKPTWKDFRNYMTQDEDEKEVQKIILSRMPLYADWKQCKLNEVDNLINLVQYHIEHGLNLGNLEGDTTMGDGNVSPDAIGIVVNPNLVPYHGTHVAGIIGAVRNNGLGMNGIADNVKIMMLKVNGNIRELRDHDLARAIHFAVDHGARVINMSFGKPYSSNKAEVDSAIKYAMDRDVLLVHAAGNNGQNLDVVEHYPNPKYGDGSGTAYAWIEVGASAWKDDSSLVPAFSNYGKNSVDVFAPGIDIYSTIPDSKYATYSGTSMAAPVVAGIATLIREYYPRLTAKQVKDIILKSVTKITHNVLVNDKDGIAQSIPFSQICKSGGIVNAYSALKLAEESSNYVQFRK